jgi:hypothetical protein
MTETFNMADFLHKISWFFGSETAEWNILMFEYDILLILFCSKKFVANRESSKWRLYSRWRRKRFFNFLSSIAICYEPTLKLTSISFQAEFWQLYNICFFFFYLHYRQYIRSDHINACVIKSPLVVT